MSRSIRPQTAQKIVETVKEVCGCDVNFIAPDGMILASTDAGRIGKYHEVGRSVALHGETIEVKSDDEYFGTHRGVNIPILFHGELIAVVGITGEPDEIRKYAFLAEEITILILREQELDSEQNSRRDMAHYIVSCLIDEDRSRSRQVSDYLRQNHLSPDAPYRTILIRVTDRFHLKNLSMMDADVRGLMQPLATGLYMFHYPNEYVIIAGDSAYRKQESAIAAFAEAHGPVARTAVSAAHPLREQFLAYAEVRSAVRSRPELALIRYEELGLEMLCYAVPQEARAEFVSRWLGALTEEEIRLLQVYYADDMSITRTAAAIYRHKNTVQYQLDRIARKTGRNPRKFQDAAAFYAAVLMQGT